MANRKRQPIERSQRWQREDAAPRLATLVPNLKALSLSLKDAVDDTSSPANGRVQHIIVPRAAALFEVACTEPKCEGGGYDLTSAIMFALNRKEETFEGTANCNGSVGQGHCRCMLHYSGRATYEPS
jgi:hypothetical protein